ncbi:hypothetical protein L6R52_09540 [Myxococcota bacterium]|nr:hypothetical protein [Myxococcota bacterium]
MEIERRRFVDTLSHRGGHLDVRYMSPQLRQAFADAGVDERALDRIAGSDHVIRGAEFSQLFDALSTSGARSADGPRARSADLGRSERLFSLLSREVDEHRAPTAPAAERALDATPTRGVGLRRSMGNERRAGDDTHTHTHTHGGDDVHRSAGGARLGITYAAPLVPEARMTETPPERPNLFIRILEALFGWLPFVSTDSERLQDHGRQLADRYESDIVAFREGYIAERSRETRSNGLPPSRPELEAEARGVMVDQLAARMTAQGVPADVARERAGVAVDAMLARVDANREANGARAASLGIPAPTSAEARGAAQLAVPAMRTAESLGGRWPERMREAMAVPADSHPLVAAQTTPEMRERAKAYVIGENVRSVSYLMALERSGQLHLPPTAIDGLLNAERNYLVGPQAVAGAASALSRMPEADRTAMIREVEALPPEKQVYAWAALAREHVALGSSSPAEVTGARARIHNATVQLQSMTTAQAETALRRGTLGLEGPRMVHLEYPGGRSLDVPMYFHPSLTQAQRDQQYELVREAYGHVPYSVMRHVIASEGGEDFNLQALPNGSLHSGTMEPELPQGLNDTGAFYKTNDNQIRLNVSVFEDIMRNDPAGGRARVVGMILHETVHDLDDLGDADQNLGFFISANVDGPRDRARTTGDGDLAPAWAHYAAIHNRFEERSQDVAGSRDAYRYYSLGRNEHRTPAEELEYAQLGLRIASRSGAMTPYAASSGVAHRGGQLGEWWAETYSAYLNPATRERLRQTDPVAHRAAERYTQLMESGVPPTEALRTALRFSLSSEVAAEQGQHILERAPRTGAMTDAQLHDLEEIGVGFREHARALDGWTPYGNDAGLKSMRRSEAEGAVTEGRRLIEAIDARRAQLARNGQAGGAEDQRLAALKTSLEASITDLEAHVRRLR